MPVLTYIANGVTYTYAPLKKQWTASAEGRKPTSSESLSALDDRVKKWTAPPAKPAPTSEPITTGLAGVSRRGSNSNHQAPSFSVVGLTGKVNWNDQGAALSWNDQGAALLRFQKKGSTSWESARPDFYVIDPSTFDEEDTTFWKAAAIHREFKQIALRAERALAAAWNQASPLASSPVCMSGRGDRANPSSVIEGVPISFQPVTSVPAHENRNYASFSSAWPVFTAGTQVTPGEADLEAWLERADGSWEHATGVVIELSEVGSYSATFRVLRPGDAGAMQEVFKSRDFSEAFQLAQMTVRVQEQNLQPVTEWMGSLDWTNQTGHHAPSWPTKVDTVAAAVIFSPDAHRISGPEPVAFALQVREKQGYSTEKVLPHPVWEKVSPSSVYWTPGPADALLGQRAELEALRVKVLSPLAVVFQNSNERLEKQSAAALAQAYHDGGDGETQTVEAAERRLNVYLERIVLQAKSSLQVKQIQDLASTFRFTVDAPKEASVVPSTDAPRARRSRRPG